MESSKRTVSIQGLGPLEAEIMRVVWDQGATTVRGVFDTLAKRREKLAYTTIMTCMTNLARKGMLRQDKTSVPYIYSPLENDTDVASRIVDRVIERLLGGSAEPVISHLLDLENEEQLQEILALRDQMHKERTK